MEVVAQYAEVELRCNEAELRLECAQQLVLRGGEFINSDAANVLYQDLPVFDVLVNGIKYTVEVEGVFATYRRNFVLLQGSMTGTKSGISLEDDAIYLLVEIDEQLTPIQKYVAVDYDELGDANWDCSPMLKALLP